MYMFIWVLYDGEYEYKVLIVEKIFNFKIERWC